MSCNIMIKVDNLSKKYQVFNRPSDRLKQMLFRGRKKYYKEFAALEGVSFEVERGSSVGIIGRNGSGKSTLLQMIAGTLSQSGGSISINGRVAALLELGSGFNLEFSGRDNVYLYGSIFGLSRTKMEERFDEIAAFADIGDFMDQPVKSYSSGMFVRLAFSVAVNVDAEILIVDEALSVGDMFFQAKCFDKISQLLKNGVTLLFVSHSLETVKALCNNCVVLHQGKMIYQGDPMKAADEYSKASLSAVTVSPESSSETVQEVQETVGSKLQPPFEKRISQRFGEGNATYQDAWITDEDGREADTLIHGKTYIFNATIRFHKDVNSESEFGIVVRNQEGIEIYAMNSFFMNYRMPAQNKGALVQVQLRHKIVLSAGLYNVSFGLRTPVQGSYNDKLYNGLVFRVVLSSGKTFIPGLVEIPGEVSCFRLEG